MPEHQTHLMQVTSLIQYFDDTIIDHGFRQKTHREIIKLLQKHSTLTDREIAMMLGYNDPNIVRPRRNELTNGKKTKTGEITIPIVLEEAGKRLCTVTGKLSIEWRISKENLNRWLVP